MEDNSKLVPPLEESDDIVQKVLEHGIENLLRKVIENANSRGQHIQRIESPAQNVNKRPFCNGFFGCTNGKRSRQRLEMTSLKLPRQITEKRFLCNKIGCFNGRKRSLYDTLLSTLANKDDKDVTDGAYKVE